MTFMLKHSFLRFAIVSMTLALSGCGNEQSSEPPLTPVTGTITLDGKPLPDADLVFHFKGTAPEAYKDAASRSDADGLFQVKSGNKLGILPGLHTVTVTRALLTGQPEVPKKYASVDTTTLELKVSGDRSTGYALELSSAGD